MKRLIIVLFAPALLLMALETQMLGQDASDVLARQYYAELQFFSLIPDDGIDSYRNYGGGGAGVPRASVGHVANDERQFELTVETQLRSREFVATVRVEPKDSDKRTQPLQRELVLSDLQPQTIELARNDDGRVYRLNLIPRIIQFPKPRIFNVGNLHLDYWSFRNSPIILNDLDYIGSMATSSGQLAFLDVSGLAKVEFSLLPFRDAKPLGSLEDGVVQITHESGSSLRISDVTNGVHREVLPGGPYQVFVRWSEPSMSVAEYQKVREESIAEVKRQIERGDRPAGRNSAQRLERALRVLDRPMMMSCGLGPIPAADVVVHK